MTKALLLFLVIFSINFMESARAGECLGGTDSTFIRTLDVNDVVVLGKVKLRFDSWSLNPARARDGSITTGVANFSSNLPEFTKYLSEFRNGELKVTNTTICPGIEVTVLCKHLPPPATQRDYYLRCTFSEF